MEIALNLTPVEVRVLGALIEKDMTTPEYYPLSLNALTNACNQKNNRDPIVSYDEATVHEGLDALHRREMARPARGGSRVYKYEHSLGEVFNFGRGEMAVVGVLLLRGAQTLVEIHTRTERMHHFDDLDALETCLRKLGEHDPPLVVKLPKLPGWRDVRYTHLFSGEPVMPVPGAVPSVAPNVASHVEESRLERLERELAELRQQFEAFKKSFE
jgi:uncharacterized protein YceH (UPF0502 family)